MKFNISKYFRIIGNFRNNGNDRIDRKDGKQVFFRYVDFYITKIHLEYNGFGGFDRIYILFLIVIKHTINNFCQNHSSRLEEIY